MEKPRLFGDTYDIITCYVLIVVGAGLFAYWFMGGPIGFLYGGSVLIVVFAGLLLFSYYARYRDVFTDLSMDRSSMIATVSVVVLILITVIAVVFFIVTGGS